MKPTLTFLTLLAALLLAPLAALHAQSADPRSLQDALRQRQTKNATMKLPLPANLERRTLKVGDAEREYFIHIPESVRGKPAPLIFALHGGASNSGLQMHYKVDFTPLADREGFVVAYPSGQRGWNVGSKDAFIVRNFTSTAEDIGFFRAMFDTLIEQRIADPKRIYLVGGSNGGMMTHRLACEFAHRIAGAAVVVATLPKSAQELWPKPSRPVPFLLMLGTADPLVKFEGSGQTLSAEDTVTFWRKQNGCEGEPKRWDLPDRDPNDGCRVHAQRWEGKAPVLFYTMEGHGHGWPMQRDRQDGTGPKTRDIAVPEEAWQFFKSTCSVPAKPGKLK
jgi:polyhydroxybutyrate depolymerase